MLFVFWVLLWCSVLSDASSQRSSGDDLCPAGESDQQVESGTGRPRETLSPSSHAGQRLGPDADRERREGQVMSCVNSLCLLRSIKAFAVTDAARHPGGLSTGKKKYNRCE